jgi:glycine cleavage system transcriptional repressor
MPTKQNLILTAVGPDKIGLVERISEFIVQHGCNIEDSKMAVFCGEFALILLISGESTNLMRIANAYHELAAQTGLNVWVKTPTVRKVAGQSLPYRLTASCMDHPGVVHRLSHLLSQQGINIESMETKTYLAPVSGTPIFRMEAEMAVPAGLNINYLRNQLGEVEREENIDIDLTLIE